ncbi:MAG: hypothetical protein Athens101410_508 [Parcubacteria group bacterium Athens1014_10]|nr:MAG: hypothetical protein Athens101410_508 [Parcubacteria group bacterium Athens1014_10]TSD05434.1 MAG: hypothetical protein Athens071412_343 [Parcubacteria group bacterium Athens0714_12]
MTYAFDNNPHAVIARRSSNDDAAIPLSVASRHTSSSASSSAEATGDKKTTKDKSLAAKDQASPCPVK